MNFKRVLITGGSGFIGTHIARKLLSDDPSRQVVALDIAAPARPVPGVTYLTHDVRRPFQEAIDGPVDIVFNLAAVHRTPGHPDHEYFETNIAGAVNATAFCERFDVKSLFFTSSISVYGPSESPVDERSPLNPDSAYGRSKALAEEIHRTWLDRGADRRLVVARPAVVFGEGENGNFTRLVRQLRSGTFVFPGRKDTRKACGYVKELASCVPFALERARPLYVFNFAYRECLTIAEICSRLVDVGQLRPPLGTLPLLPLEVAAMGIQGLKWFGLRTAIDRDRIRKLVHSTYVIPSRLVADGYSYRFTLETAFADWFQSDSGLGIMLREQPIVDCLGPDIANEVSRHAI